MAKVSKADAQRQVADRWTPQIAGSGWTPVSDYFLKNYHRLRITHSEAMVLIHLVSFKWDAAAPFPSLKTVGKRMGITVASVRSHLRNLEGKGFLTRQMRVGKTNRFHLRGLFEAIEKLMDLDAQQALLATDVESEDEILV